MQIIQVANRSQLKEFINQPYRDCWKTSDKIDRL